MATLAHLVLACALAALAALAAHPALAAPPAPADDYGRCDSAEIGNVTGEVYSRVERLVLPESFMLVISEPDMCSGSEPVGMKVTACDTEEPPHVFLLELTHGVVVREGALRTEAYVYITMFCSDSGQAAFEVISTTSGVAESPQLDTEPENPPNPVQLESRVSSVSKDSLVGPLSGRPSLVNVPSRFKEPLPDQPKLPPMPTPEELSSLWIQSKSLALQKLKQKFDSIRWHENETLTSPGLGQPDRFDSYSSLMNKIISSYHSKDPMLGKRLSELRPGTTPPWLFNRSPAWLKRPAKRSSAWLRQGFLPDWSIRKSLSRPHKRIGRHNRDDGEQWWPSFEEDTLLLQSEEASDPYPWWTDNKLLKNSPPIRPSPSAIQHITKNQLRYVPPLHESDRTITTDWQDQLSKRSPLPKLLLLLHEPEHTPIMKMKCDSPHSVEDGDAWCPIAKSEYLDDGKLWQPDYPADYTADDGDSFSLSDKLLLSQVGPTYKEGSFSPPAQYLERPPVPNTTPTFVSEAPVVCCPKCPPVNAVEERKQFRPRNSRVSKELLSSSQMFRRPPLQHKPYGTSRIGQNHPIANTEHPMLSSTPRYAEGSKAAPESMLESVEQGEHPASAHWDYLSKLLLSHPTFRDSTHVIRFK